MKNPSSKTPGRVLLPASFCETVYMLATLFCAAVIGAFIGLGWA